MVDVPTKNSVTDAAKTGGVNGTVLALGETVGRSVIGPGLGTAAGGVATAAAMSGNDRDMMATIAVERGMSEIFAGGSGGGNSRGRM